MALVKGTNCGFVTEAPASDPEGSNSSCDNISYGLKDTGPENASRVTEIGWFCDNESEAADFEVAIYDHNSGDNNPEDIVGSKSSDAKGTDSGWKKISGLNIPITPGETYWIAFSLANTSTATNKNYSSEAGEKFDLKGATPELPDPWGVSDATYEELIGIYAVVEQEDSSETNSASCLRKQSIQANGEVGLFA